MYSPSDDTETPPGPRSNDDEEVDEEVDDEEEEYEVEETTTQSDDGQTDLPVNPTASVDGTPAATPGGTVPAGGQGNATGDNTTTRIIAAVDSLDSLHRCPQLREVANSSNDAALSWQLSSAKPGNGVEQIRDSSTETYWQSDGVTQPHWIQVHFGRRVAISHVCLYLDYHLDESYTPKTIQIEAGMTAQDLIPAVHPATAKIEFHEPSGWCIIPLRAPPDPLDDEDEDEEEEEDDDEEEDDLDLDKHNQKPLLRAHLIRISILSMHQNGRDTHVRRLALFARQKSTVQPFRIVRLNNDSRKNTDKAEVEDDGEQKNENSSDRHRRQIQQQHWQTDSWNHHRNAAAADFSTLGMNQFSTIR
jgi:anaphase-promoting complex subunit 10